MPADTSSSQRWTGTVERVRAGRRYGFVRLDDSPDGPQRVAFLHLKDLPRGVALRNGLRLSCCLVDDPRGLAVVHARTVDAGDASGCNPESRRCAETSAAQRFRAGLRALLVAHGLEVGERLHLAVTANPARVAIADAAGWPVLAIDLDDREPATFGRPVTEG